MKTNIKLSILLVLGLFFMVCSIALSYQTIKKQYLIFRANDTISTDNINWASGAITIKQKEVLDTVLMVETIVGVGSGTIIKKENTKTDNYYQYFILTNAHVTRLRLTKKIEIINIITGENKEQLIDTGCRVIVFDKTTDECETFDADVVAEDVINDLAVLSFRTSRILSVARIATINMLKEVCVFDEIFAVGCQLGMTPIPTRGIISKITIYTKGQKQSITYNMTSHTTPGSSGGGLFKEYGGHYYLIGIPYTAYVSSNGQIMPHLAKSISIVTARDFIDKNTGGSR